MNAWEELLWHTAERLVTAIHGLGELMPNGMCFTEAAVAQASRKHFPSGLYRDEEGQARVFAKRFTFAGMFNAAFHQLRQNAGPAVSLYLRLLEVFSELAPLMRTEEQKEVLRLHSAMVHETCREKVSQSRDLHAAEIRYAEIENYFRESEAETSPSADRD